MARLYLQQITHLEMQHRLHCLDDIDACIHSVAETLKYAPFCQNCVSHLLHSYIAYTDKVSDISAWNTKTYDVQFDDVLIFTYQEWERALCIMSARDELSFLAYIRYETPQEIPKLEWYPMHVEYVLEICKLYNIVVDFDDPEEAICYRPNLSLR